MLDRRQYYKQLLNLLNSEEQVWQATIIKTAGSSPAAVGMRLAVPLCGQLFGNLGGGNLEHNVISWIRENKPAAPLIRAYNLNEEGDIAEVNTTDNDRQTAAEKVKCHRSSVVLQTEKSSTAMNLSKKETAENETPATMINTDMICGGNAVVFIEPLFSPEHLYIIGAGHCGKALANIAACCSFKITVIDNRSDQLLESAFPSGVRTVRSDYDDFEKVMRFGEDTYIVIMTYGHQHDSLVLEKCLGKKYRYLGMIGSKKKVVQTFEKLLKKGYDETELSRVSAPVGLQIGSKTPYEIAVSVTAELIEYKRRK